MSHRISCEHLGAVGRLGNSLFQLAATIGLVKPYGATPLFPSSFKYRSVFNLPAEWFAPDLWRETVDVYDLPETAYLSTDWRWYLQDLRLWNHATIEVRQVLTLQPEAKARVDELERQLLGKHPGVVTAVHVRRGDNVTNVRGTINALPESYYRDALNRLAKSGPLGTVLVVSDDVGWCIDHLSDVADTIHGGIPGLKEQHPDYATEEPTDWVDMMLLARATRHVVSNSTFAWWGAWLARNNAPVRPSYWVGEQLLTEGCEPELILPAHWPVVECEAED